MRNGYPLAPCVHLVKPINRNIVARVLASTRCNDASVQRVFSAFPTQRKRSHRRDGSPASVGRPREAARGSGN